MIAVVLGVVLAFAMILVAFAYTAARDDAARSAARFEAQTKRVRALSAAVERLSDTLDAGMERTDATVVTGARRTMGVLGDAIRREGRVIEASVGRNRKAIAAMGALLDANMRSLSELVGKVSVEDRALLAKVMAKMEARHVEIVSYLSGGGMDKVAAAVAAAAVGTEHFGAEHFSTLNMRAALLPVALDDARLRKLDADLKADVAAGLSLKEAMYVRLSQIAPVTQAARAAADNTKAVSEYAREESHREALRAVMAEQHALQTEQILGDAKAGRAELLGDAKVGRAELLGEAAAGRAELLADAKAGRAELLGEAKAGRIEVLADAKVGRDVVQAQLQSVLQNNMAATEQIRAALSELQSKT